MDIESRRQDRHGQFQGWAFFIDPPQAFFAAARG